MSWIQIFPITILKRIHFFRYSLLLWFCLLMMPLSTSYPQESQSAVGISAAKDSTEYYRKKYRGKKTWEHIVSLPGTIIGFPLVLFFKAQEGIVGYIYDEKLIPRAREFVTSADGKRRISPTYSNRSGIGLKLSQKAIFNPESKLNVIVTGGFDNRQRYRIEWRNLQIAGPIFTNLRARYRFLPNESFFGIGPNSREDSLSHFNHEYSAGEAGLALKISPQLHLSGNYRWDQNNVYHSPDEAVSTIDVYNPSTVSGLQTGVRISQFEGGLSYDSRNKKGNPSAGFEIALSTTLFKDVDNGLFNFRKFSADISRYIHFGYNRVLKLRFVGETTRPLGENDDIPFYFLSEIGYRSTVRGFSRGRFRDRDLFIGSAEYRIPLWHRIDSFLFVDAGHVAHDIFDAFSPDLLNFGYGGGLRLWNHEDVKAIVQFAISKERFRIYFNLN